MPRKTEPLPEQRSIGIWIRVSTEDQARGESLAHHEHRARHYIEAKGWEVREVYRLEGVSGKAVMEHPETKRMLADLRSGRITALIFSKLARLARSTRQLLDFADIFREHGADLVSLQESIDTTTPAGRLFYTMIAAMAQWEREEIAERVAASVPIRAKLGKPLSGQAVYGYRWKDKKLIPHPNEAPIRRRMYQLFLKFRRVKAVASTLNEEGYRTRDGFKFTDTTVKRLLQDPTAKGLRRANYTTQNGDRGFWKFKPESDWVMVPVEPIVSEDLWGQCNALLSERRRSDKLQLRRPVHLFGGITFCACGTKMQAKADKGKYICPACLAKIPMQDLEAVFREQLHSLVSSPAHISQYVTQADQSLADLETLLVRKTAERREVAGEIDRIYELYLAREIPKQGFGERIRPYEERLKQIEEELPRLQAEIDILKIHHLSRDEVLSQASDLYARWGDLPHEERRSIIEAVTEKIVVAPDAVEIDVCYLMPPQMAGEWQRSKGAASSPSSRTRTATRSS